ncbi:hypothetical protein TWF730_002508 [Orbilia blumenaviensis]|uniref:N-acetyltransferase domain-containing protein n=1 Tax=Orbilia blumenaviensis TaxID=1796055 RepID=A0AAV9UEA6_9PEZI
MHRKTNGKSILSICLYHRFHIFGVFLLALLLLLASRHGLLRSQRTMAISPESPPGFATRSATRGDLEAITTIAILGWVFDKQWDYRFPYAKQYPEDHRHWTKARYSQYMDEVEAGKAMMMVAEKRPDSSSTESNIVAFSIWQLPGHHIKPATPGKPTPTGPSTQDPERKDANLARMKLFREVLNKGKAQYFDNIYGESQLYLMTLVTHPDHFRRGAGTTLMRWGLEKAKQEKLVITLFASQMGYGLYKKLGFGVVGEVTVQIEGEEEKLNIPGMTIMP